MKNTDVATCLVCRKNKSSFYISTKALMHKKNDEKYIFNICNNCETVYLTNPVPTEKLEQYYTDNYLPYKGADAWGKYSSFVVNSQKQLDLKRVNFVKSQLSNNKSELNILDVGCGNPSFLELLEKKTKAHCTGIDFSDSGWKHKNFINLELKKIAIEDFDTKIRYDVITMWHYLEHDYNPHQTIEKLYTLLKPGGKIIIEVPNYDSLTAKFQKSFWQGWHSPRHISLLTKNGFSFLFPVNKWKIAKHLSYGTLDAFTLLWLGKMEKKGIDWSGNMANHFWMLVFLKIITAPIFLFEKIIPLGIQIIVVDKK